MEGLLEAFVFVATLILFVFVAVGYSLIGIFILTCCCGACAKAVEGRDTPVLATADCVRDGGHAAQATEMKKYS